MAAVVADCVFSRIIKQTGKRVVFCRLKPKKQQQVWVVEDGLTERQSAWSLGGNSWFFKSQYRSPTQAERLCTLSEMAAAFETTLEWPRFCYSGKNGSLKLQRVVFVVLNAMHLQDLLCLMSLRLQKLQLDKAENENQLHSKTRRLNTVESTKQASKNNQRSRNLHSATWWGKWQANTKTKTTKSKLYLKGTLKERVYKANFCNRNAPKARLDVGWGSALSNYLPFPALRGATNPIPSPFASLLPFGLSPNSTFVNPFALGLVNSKLPSESNPLDLSPNYKSDDEVDVLSIDPPSSPQNVEDWSVNDVADFVATIDSCAEYSEVRIFFLIQ